MQREQPSRESSQLPASREASRPWSNCLKEGKKKKNRRGKERKSSPWFPAFVTHCDIPELEAGGVAMLDTNQNQNGYEIQPFPRQSLRREPQNHSMF